MSLAGAVESIARVGLSAFLVRVRPESAFEFLAGQYVKLDEGYYSIASPPESAVLEFVVRASGRGTAADHLVQMSPGARVEIQGPFGKLGFKQRHDRHACFICQGTGISPFFSIIRSRAFTDAAPPSTLFLVGFRDEQEMIPQDVLGAPLPADRYRVSLSQPRGSGWAGLRGRVTEHLRAGTLGIDWRHTEFYLCGSLEMLNETKAILVGHGVEAGAVHSEI